MVADYEIQCNFIETSSITMLGRLLTKARNGNGSESLGEGQIALPQPSGISSALAPKNKTVEQTPVERFQ